MIHVLRLVGGPLAPPPYPLRLSRCSPRLGSAQRSCLWLEGGGRVYRQPPSVDACRPGLSTYGWMDDLRTHHSHFYTTTRRMHTATAAMSALGLGRAEDDPRRTALLAQQPAGWGDGAVGRWGRRRRQGRGEHRKGWRCAPSTLHSAPCTLHLAPCTVHRAPRAPRRTKASRMANGQGPTARWGPARRALGRGVPGCARRGGGTERRARGCVSAGWSHPSIHPSIPRCCAAMAE